LINSRYYVELEYMNEEIMWELNGSFFIGGKKNG
jgi:hypothetical protein